MQADGNLVLYGPEWDAIWSSGTYGKTVSSAIMQADGNFVLYSTGGIPVWSSGTWGNPGASLSIQDDGKVVVNDINGKTLWNIPAEYIDTQLLISKLIALKAADPAKKIAFVFSGGGARAAWFGGVLEAIEREVRRQQPNVPANQRFAPDILVGTSGGGLAAVGYFADLMNSGEYGPYVNRQSWLWQEITRNNEAALKLLDNPGVLELLSGSRTGDGQFDWQSVKDKPLSNFLNLANIPNFSSPSYNFYLLIDSLNRIGEHIKDVQVEFTELIGSFEKLFQAFHNIYGRLNLNLGDYSSAWIERIKNAKNAVHGVLVQFIGIRDSITFDSDVLKHPVQNAKELVDAIKNLVSDGGGRLVDALNALNNITQDLLNTPIETIVSQYEDIKKIVPVVIDVHQKLADFLKAVGIVKIKDTIQLTIDILLQLDDVIEFLIATIKMVKKNSSLMNTNGLKNAIHEVLRMATPTKFAANGKASSMDEALLTYWQSQRTAKQANPLIRAPELILTGGNITANRLSLFTLCDEDTAKRLADMKRWVIGLNFKSSGFLRGKALTRTKSASPSNPRVGENWIFGAWANDFIPPMTVNSEIDKLNVAELATFNQPPATSKTKLQLKTTGACPFEHQAGVSLISGTSIIAGAALTTSAIPVAFPPRLWRFENEFLKKVYSHWFVDGGICDNRPIEHAVDAGADYIVSFEVIPLRKMISDIPSIGKKPNFIGVISSALIDTPLESPFKRFIESYVANNPPKPGKSPEKKIWRFAPEAASGKEDETIGSYDFNGFWNKGVLKMGLFDWFMRGYLDGSKSLSQTNSATTDPVSDNYNSIDYGQLKNAAQEKSTPGYFEVDFYNNKPHPGM